MTRFTLALLALCPFALADDPEPKAVRTVTREGFKLSITLDRTTFKAGEDITLKGKLENVAGKDLFVYWTNRADIRFVDTRTGDAWVTHISRLPPPPGEPPSRAVFEAKGVKEIVAGVGGTEKMLREKDALDRTRPGLPPGRYRLEYSTTFIDHNPRVPRRAYTGTLKVEPILIEIKAR